MPASRRTFLGRIVGGVLPAMVPGSISPTTKESRRSGTHHETATPLWLKFVGTHSQGASPGQASGRIQRVTIDDDTPGYASRDAISGLTAVAPGDIVVTPDLYPNMVEELRPAAGLVVYEEQSLCGRGAVVARELGLPAVIDCPHARAFRSGVRARIDGDQGTIHIPIRVTVNTASQQ